MLRIVNLLPLNLHFEMAKMRSFVFYLYHNSLKFRRKKNRESQETPKELECLPGPGPEHCRRQPSTDRQESLGSAVKQLACVRPGFHSQHHHIKVKIQGARHRWREPSLRRSRGRLGRPALQRRRSFRGLCRVELVCLLRCLGSDSEDPSTPGSWKATCITPVGDCLKGPLTRLMPSFMTKRALF